MKRDNVCDTVSNGSYFATIEPDDSGIMESPREDDNLGTMVCFHNQYILGDTENKGRLAGKGEYTFNDPEDFTEWLHDNRRDIAVILPLFLYDHSGISISTGREYPFNDCWDSGQVGYIFVTKEQVKANWPVKIICKSLKVRVTEQLKAEVKAYDQYLTGDIYGYRLFKVNDDFDPDNDDPEDFGGEVDSCWGFYGNNWKREVNEQIAYFQEQDKKAAVNETEKAWLSVPVMAV